MTRRGLASAASLASAAMLAVTVQANLQRPTLTASSSFAEILTEYQLGDHRRAVDVLARWDDERLDAEAIVELSDAIVPPAAAALLLTEAGLASRRFGRLDDDIPRRGYALRGWGLERAFEPFSYASHQLIERLAGTAKKTHDTELLAWIKSWYILTSSHCLEFDVPCAHGLLEKGLHHLDEEDPEVMLWRGSMKEPPILTRSYYKYNLRSVAHGQESRYWFRRAVKARPSLVEARMRLGRSLYVTQNDPDATAILEQALADGREQRHVFAAHLSALLLGEIREDAEDLDGAVAYYRQAVEIYRGHTASIALGLALVRNGQREEGWSQGRLMFGTKDEGTASLLDPWAVARSAQYWQSASRLSEMRKAVRGGRQ